MTLFKIFITALLIDNIVLMRFLALCPFLGMRTEEKSISMGLAVTFVTVLATCVTWPIYKFILEPLGLVFLQILVFILVIASLTQLIEFYLKKVFPSLFNSLGIYLALMATNCAILVVTFDVITKGYTFIESLVYSVGVATGFLLSMLLLVGIRKRISTSPVPAFLNGTPVLFVATALLSIAFMGFSGLVK